MVGLVISVKLEMQYPYKLLNNECKFIMSDICHIARVPVARVYDAMYIPP